MKVLITGARGLLGSYLVQHFSGQEILELNRDDCDLRNQQGIFKIVRDFIPDVIVHAAAYTNVDGCESSPLLARQINVEGTSHLVSAAHSLKTHFMYISSTGVYGGHLQRPYTELDPVKPTTEHHLSKLEGEQAVIKGSSCWTVVRTGWLYGGTALHAKNFVMNRIREARSKDILYGDAAQHGNPTFAENVARQVAFLALHKQEGIFNCVDSPPASRLEYVSAIVQEAGLRTKVLPAPAGMFSRIAPVSMNEMAENTKLIESGINFMEDWRLALARYIQTINRLNVIA